MEALSDKRLNRVRLRFLDLLKSFFLEAPDAEKLSRWRGTFAALTEQQISPALDKSVYKLNKLLSEKNPDQIREEFYQLFINPYGDGIIEITLSAYQDGHNYGLSLAKLRGLLQDAGIAKFTDISDSEDSLVLMLDLLATLIENEELIEQSRMHQDSLLSTYLAPLAQLFAAQLQDDKRAEFYKSCGEFLTSYMDLEQGLTETEVI